MNSKEEYEEQVWKIMAMHVALMVKLKNTETATDMVRHFQIY